MIEWLGSFLCHERQRSVFIEMQIEKATAWPWRYFSLVFSDESAVLQTLRILPLVKQLKGRFIE